ncbi:MAG: trigger factor [Xanthomonadales bacterium]|nr:trigger factor [Xanthomonadales bacterium]
MEVTVEKSSELQRKLTVKIPSEQLEKKMDARLREIGKQVKIKGFRPGKIPPKVLKQRYGKSVKQEVVSEVVQSSLFEAIENESLRPASNPVLDNIGEFGEGTDLEFTASIEVYPEIGPIDVSGIEISNPDTEVVDTDVDEMLQTLQQQRQSWEDTDEPAGDGHQVVVEYLAEVNGTTVPAQGKQRLSLVLGTSGFEDLENAVTGKRAGDRQETELRFPDGYGDKQLAGNVAKVELEVIEVQHGRIPDIDEEFIRSFAVESGQLEDLRSEVKANLERELQQARNTWLKSQVVKQLLAQHANLQVPDAIVSDEAERLKKQAAEQQGEEAENLPDEIFRNAAERRVRSGLLLAEMARQNNIVVDGARVRKAIETVAETYEQPMEVVQMYYGNQQLLGGVESLVLEEQVVDWVVENAKVDEQSMTMKEVINAAANSGQAE